MSNGKRKTGEVILDVQNISLSFGGVKALTDISFNVREHEVRAIIGPNGAGKSSMLNCINGVYWPQQGQITFRGQTFKHMNSRQVAEMGVARTFQNLALFKGMSVIDNIMTGRNLKIKSNLLLQALRIGPAEREEIRKDQADCMGCLSHCGFSSWKDHDDYTTGRLADPRSFCIQKTLQDIAHGGPVDQNLMFAGHAAYRFKQDPFYSNNFTPSVKQLVDRILTGD